MSCNNNQCSSNQCQHTNRCGAGYIIIIVLYILLAIILGSYIAY